MNVQPNAQVIDMRRLYDPSRNEKQMQFHSAPQTYKLYGGAMGGGKTAALVNEGIQLSLDYKNNLGLLMRKTYPSFRNTVLPQLEKFLPPALVKTWNSSSHFIELINGSRILYGGIGDDPNDWEKFMSGEYGWIALDQAEEFTETEFKMLATRLRLNLPRIRYFFLLSCNPTVGWIKARFLERNLPDHVFIPALPSDNARNLPSDYIAKMEAILDANLSRALLHGDWEAVGEANDVFSYGAVQAAMQRSASVGLPVQYGVDVARSGNDETSVYLRQGACGAAIISVRGHDTMQTAGEVYRHLIQELLPEWKAQAATRGALKEVACKIDADGLGAGVVDRLKELREEIEERAAALLGYEFIFHVTEIHGGGKARDPVRFRNQRAEIHWGMREMVKDGTLSLAEDRELLVQLMSLKYGIDSSGRIFIAPKDEIKERLGRSPDRAEAAIYAFANVSSEFGFEVL